MIDAYDFFLYANEQKEILEKRHNETSNGIFIKEKSMTLGTILLIVLILALVGAIPTWGYSSNWGYGPSGGVGFVLLIVLILVMLGHI